MTLDQFNALNTDERAGVAMQGNFDLRFEGDLKALYSHRHVYAEVFYDGEATQIVQLN